MGTKSSLRIGKSEDCGFVEESGFVEGEGGWEGVGSRGSSIGKCESAASRRNDLLLLPSSSEIDNIESSSFPALVPLVESDCSSGTTADRVARVLFVPFFLISLGIMSDGPIAIMAEQSLDLFLIDKYL